MSDEYTLIKTKGSTKLLNITEEQLNELLQKHTVYDTNSDGYEEITRFMLNKIPCENFPICPEICSKRQIHDTPIYFPNDEKLWVQTRLEEYVSDIISKISRDCDISAHLFLECVCDARKNNTSEWLNFLKVFANVVHIATLKRDFPGFGSNYQILSFKNGVVDLSTGKPIFRERRVDDFLIYTTDYNYIVCTNPKGR